MTQTIQTKTEKGGNIDENFSWYPERYSERRDDGDFAVHFVEVK